ncbi:HIT family protein [Guyparkeria hydrothermalis]|uniref:HIT family protein n=1 Tax=Guyparkeria TaxID=2035712 RepID=UPI0010ABCD6D|nr:MULTISPECIES: HIT family protein [Guyparkeria]MCL7751266.1 HIT family protein [Guyparkeria hydrothermalis]TKA89620.1 HIT family protein [Guyparkeria sp. SB14A]
MNAPRPDHDDWTLHPRLKADSFPIIQHGRLQFRLINDRRFVWVLIVPMHPGAEQLHQLSADWREETLTGLQALSETLEHLYDPDRLNVGAIGNLVDQLHVHCVVRRADDPAWPGVVWGAGTPEPMEPIELLARVQPIAAGLGDALARHSERPT